MTYGPPREGKNPTDFEASIVDIDRELANTKQTPNPIVEGIIQEIMGNSSKPNNHRPLDDLTKGSEGQTEEQKSQKGGVQAWKNGKKCFTMGWVDSGEKKKCAKAGKGKTAKVAVTQDKSDEELSLNK